MFGLWEYGAVAGAGVVDKRHRPYARGDGVERKLKVAAVGVSELSQSGI